MKLLATSDELINTLEALLRSCDKLRWAVAWASSTAPSFRLLSEHRMKISQLTVGLSSFNTHPRFIEEFLNLGGSKVQFIEHGDTLFHPKLYYFEHGGSHHWDCIIGSPNFTGPGFKENIEVAVWISSNDIEAHETKRKICATLDKYRSEFKRIDEMGLEAYRDIWSRQKKRHVPRLNSDLSLSGHDDLSSNGLLFKRNWSEQYKLIKARCREETCELPPKHQGTLEERLMPLKETNSLFKQYGSYGDMCDILRLRIAGCRQGGKNRVWHWFGTIQGDFLAAVKGEKPEYKETPKKISAALDCIPLAEDRYEITHSDFISFLKLFRHAYPYGNPLSSMTRLLAFRRPDYFVCLNGGNTPGLFNELNITHLKGSKKLNVDSYWDTIIEPILQMNWWNSPEPIIDENERRVWKCRAAFLDVLFYSS